MAKKVKKGTEKKVAHREMANEELSKNFVEAKKRLQELRFSKITASVKNVKEISQIKKNIARIHTEKRRREIEAAAK